MILLLVFTAFITSRLSRTVQGKVMVLMMIMIMESAIDGTSLSPSFLVMFIKLVKLAKEEFTMSSGIPNMFLQFGKFSYITFILNLH